MDNNIDIHKIAKLAQIELQNNEIDEFSKDIHQMVNYFLKLKQKITHYHNNEDDMKNINSKKNMYFLRKDQCNQSTVLKIKNIKDLFKCSICKNSKIIKQYFLTPNPTKE